MSETSSLSKKSVGTDVRVCTAIAYEPKATRNIQCIKEPDAAADLVNVVRLRSAHHPIDKTYATKCTPSELAYS